MFRQYLIPGHLTNQNSKSESIKVLKFVSVFPSAKEWRNRINIAKWTAYGNVKLGYTFIQGVMVLGKAIWIKKSKEN